jgi:hypothetical protein
MPEVLRWPFRIILYGMAYILWAMASLVILFSFPSMTSLEAINVLPAGWIPIAAVFFADVYFNQLRKREGKVGNRVASQG